MVILDHWTAGGLHLLSGLVIEAVRPRPVLEPASCSCHCHLEANGTGCDALERLFREEIRRAPGGVSLVSVVWLIGLAATLCLVCLLAGCGAGLVIGRRTATSARATPPATPTPGTVVTLATKSLTASPEKDVTLVTEAVTPASRRSRNGTDFGRA